MSAKEYAITASPAPLVSDAEVVAAKRLFDAVLPQPTPAIFVRRALEEAAMVRVGMIGK